MNNYTCPFCGSSNLHENKWSLDAELTEAMASLVQQVRDTHKKGSITLSLSVSMLNDSTDDVMKITPEIKLNLPKVPQPSSVFWSTADGDLLRNDPQQLGMDFTTIGDEKPNKVIKIEGVK